MPAMPLPPPPHFALPLPRPGSEAGPADASVLVKPPARGLVIAFIVATVISVVLASAVYLQTRALERASERLFTMRLPALEAISSLRGPIAAQQAILYRYYASRDVNEFRQLYRSNHAMLVTHLDKLEHALDDQDATICRIGLGEVQSLAEQLESTLSSPRPDDGAAMALLSQVGMHADQMGGELASIVDDIRSEFSASVEETHAATRFIAFIVYGYSAVLLLLGTLVAFNLKRYFEASGHQRTIALFPERNPSAVLRLDSRGAITYANPGARDLLAVIGHAGGEPLRLLPDDLAERLQALREAAPPSADWEYAVGNRILHCKAHYIEQDDVFHAYPVDVTAQREAERALNDALGQVSELGKRLADENVYLKAEMLTATPSSDIVGQSPRLNEVLARIDQVAGTSATVLILGESGVGKESLARALHDRSDRRDKPFIKLNCAAIPSNLVESELFGHEKGAFTGAATRRLGRFELADGGTLFLDEIGELPPDTQAKLLRVLQEHEFERVGGQTTVKVDVRIVVATHRDLKAMVKDGSFRADLYYRINVFPVELPPLRQRREDIPALVAHFLKKFSTDHGKAIDGVSARALERLQAYDWPGNIRELQNVIERATIVCRGSVLDVPPLGDNTGPPAATPATALDLESVERRHITQVLGDRNWVIEGKSGAAATLGLAAGTLRSRMKKLGIERPRGG
ncbi:sigma-54-dependent Fis family transcriptional regulator [Methyloversatilis sp. XJ19-49]|uniref:sigma-54 interaction domain-containing protein n=1 Tax=Methyloversatilis sp. XJ19-49 TaxID=2963429 RepID=UPI00211B9EB5|nr:sigma 54-interacting transcriptional regulator [Methyloversatilis sp. XJ19-49]MCQ9378265.1 sigma 54-interacting transcriptional regulator [Methyloversatilis sp. XJ19-49]